MGFRAVKNQVIKCLENGRVQHAMDRCEIDVKNLLATGQVSADEVAGVIGRAGGNDYECRSHHFDESVEVHIITTNHMGTNWYIKWYYIEPDVVFISVH